MPDLTVLVPHLNRSHHRRLLNLAEANAVPERMCRRRIAADVQYLVAVVLSPVLDGCPQLGYIGLDVVPKDENHKPDDANNKGNDHPHTDHQAKDQQPDATWICCHRWIP